jgi:tetratricopeptide (TPR) repeat protein
MEEKISSIAEFLRWISGLDLNNYLFRGQANHQWPLRSGAARRICGEKTTDKIDNNKILEYILGLINNVKKKEFHFKGNLEYSYHLKILADLQHHGAATNLIDFSKNSLIALWMACSDEFNEDGRVFAVDSLNSKEITEIDNNNIKDDIDKLLHREGTTLPDDLQKILEHSNDGDNIVNSSPSVWFWEPANFDTRILSQSSVFLFGLEILQISTYEKIIDRDSKELILEDLNRFFNINEETIYSDFVGFAKANSANKAVSQFGWEYYYKKIKEKIECKSFFKALELCCYTLKLMDRESNNDILKRAKIHLAIAEITAEKYNSRCSLRTDNSLRQAIEHASHVIDILSPPHNDAKILFNAYVLRGFQYGLSSDYAKAISDYENAKSLIPDDPYIFIEIGRLKEKFGKNGALAAYQKALKLTSEPTIKSDIYTHISSYYRKHKNAIKEENSLRLAIKLNDANDIAIDKLALSLSKHRKYNEALEMNQKLLELRTQNAETLASMKIIRGEEAIKGRIKRLRKYIP